LSSLEAASSMTLTKSEKVMPNLRVNAFVWSGVSQFCERNFFQSSAVAEGSAQRQRHFLGDELVGRLLQEHAGLAVFVEELDVDFARFELPTALDFDGHGLKSCRHCRRLAYMGCGLTGVSNFNYFARRSVLPK
jgi:hypothetical protein